MGGQGGRTRGSRACGEATGGQKAGTRRAKGQVKAWTCAMWPERRGQGWMAGEGGLVTVGGASQRTGPSKDRADWTQKRKSEPEVT